MFSCDFFFFHDYKSSADIAAGIFNSLIFTKNYLKLFIHERLPYQLNLLLLVSDYLGHNEIFILVYELLLRSS